MSQIYKNTFKIQKNFIKNFILKLNHLQIMKSDDADSSPHMDC